MNLKTVRYGLLALSSVFILGGCASTNYADLRDPTISGSHALGEAATGAVVGGAAGALIGKAAGGSATTGAAIGAAVGGTTGYIHGRGKDRSYSGYR